MFYAERLRITAYCSLDFKDFPFDYHYCNLSFGLSNLDVNSFQLLSTNVTYGDLSTMSPLKKHGIYIDSSNLPVPFDVTLTSLEPFTEKEYGYQFSFVGKNGNGGGHAFYFSSFLQF